MDNIEDIVKGWKNYFFNDPVTEEVGKQRMSICLRCDRYSKLTGSCGVCHCFMVAKVRLNSAKCPLNKWEEKTE